jgi:hypothetical protein
MRVAKLIGDVDKDGGAARGDAPLGYKMKKPGQKLFQLHRGRTFRGQAEEFGREILGVIMRLLAAEIGGGTQGKVAETETKLRVRAGQATALTVGKAMMAAGWLSVSCACGP